MLGFCLNFCFSSSQYISPPNLSPPPSPFPPSRPSPLGPPRGPKGPGEGDKILGLSFDFLFLPLVRLWVPFGSSGQLLDHIGAPWVAMEVDLSCPRRYNRCWTKFDVQFRAGGSQLRCLRTTQILPGTFPRDPGYPPEVARGGQLPNPLHSAGGRMT